MTPFLEIADLSFAFDAAPVLRGVSFGIERGALVGLLGPNGSGKTTLLRLIAGVLRPQAGRIRIDGADLSSLHRRALARRVAVVPQETALAFDYTVLELVLMGRYPHLGPFEIEGPADIAAAFAALDATGTRALAPRPFHTLSGGEKQRVVIASALAQLNNGACEQSESAAGRPSEEFPDVPRLLLLDEPTASLDLRYQLQVASLVERLHAEQGITILISTHDLRFARAVCTHVVLLSQGRVLAQGTPAAVLTPARVGDLYEIDPDLAAPILGR